MKRIISSLLVFVVSLCLMNTNAMSESITSNDVMINQQNEAIPRATKITSIIINKPKNTLRVADEQQRIFVDIKYTGTAPKQNDVIMYSKNPRIAEIFDKGEEGFWIEAYKIGKVTIVAECFGKSSSLTLNITDYAPTTVSLNKTELTILIGETYTLKGTVLPKKANQILTWISRNKSVATVSFSGVVTGKAIGAAIITVTTDNDLETECLVTVMKKAIPTPTPKPTSVTTPTPSLKATITYKANGIVQADIVRHC